MSALNFREIPAANSFEGVQDTFEMFGRDFLEYIGYRTISGPNRGADRGKDLIVVESRIGVGGETEIKWLVSCKHKAHSGMSVTPQDEQNIRDRLELHRCNGFLGVYSTLPSSGLSEILDGLKNKHEVRIYDWGQIEKSLLSTIDGVFLAQRYFPESTRQWKLECRKASSTTTTKIAGRKITIPEDMQFKAASVFDIVMLENGVEQLFYKHTNGVAELYCRKDELVANLFNFILSPDDCLAHEHGATPDLWRYFEAHPVNEDVLGILKFQYFLGSKGMVSLYKINYTKQQLLITKLREFVDDWDEVADG
jgi:hypothetical protein